MHVHTRYSHDALITSKELSIYAKNQGLDGVAITDHNEVRGLREFSKIKSLLVIPGIEISTKQGHVLGINISTIIQPDLSFAETIDEIHDAGGLAIIAHSTAFFKGIQEDQLDENFDAIEVINASTIPFSLSVQKNLKVAARLNLPQTGGSDAHYAPEIGMAYTTIDAEIDVDEVVKAIKNGASTAFGKPIPWSVRLKRKLLTLRKKKGRL